MSENAYQAKQVADKSWVFHDKTHVASYLVEGKEKALLIDTGWGIGNLAELVQIYTSLPLNVVFTHGHPDHICGAFQFSNLHISNEDKEFLNAFYNTNTRKHIIENHKPYPAGFSKEKWINAKIDFDNISSVQEGDIFNLGERKLNVIEVPGHTSGSICLLDEENKILFSGDSIQTAPVLMHLGESLPLSTYLDSLIHIHSFNENFDIILPSHGKTPINKTILDELINGASDILDGKITGELEQTFFGEGLICKFNNTSIIYDDNRL